MNANLKILLSLGGVVAAISVAWGTLNQKVSTHEKDLLELRPLIVSQAVVLEKLSSIDESLKDLKTDVSYLKRASGRGASLGQRPPRHE